MTFGITQADIFLNLTRNRDTWKQDADMNGDGYVTQYEFSNYIVGEFNGAVDMGSDVISRFWNKFDTNKTGKLGNTDLNNRYALDETELERLGKQLEYYQVLDDYINDIDPPTVLSSTQYKWLSAIKNELSMVVENYTGNSNNLQATLDASFNNIKNYYTAVFCAEECLKDHDIFSQVPGYDYEQDRTLMNIIECFCNNLPNSSNEIAIKSGIQNIIKEYIDKAGFETNISLHTDLAQYDPSYNPNKWNDLQKAVIRNKLLEEYSSNENYSKYSTLYNSLIEEYINTLGSGSAFDDVIDHLTDKFKASDHGKKLTLIDEFLTDYSNLDSSSSLYDTLSDALGNDATDIITTNDIDTTFYKNIINEILNKIISGEIENLDDMENTIYNQIITNLDAFKKDLIKKVDAGKVVDLTDTLWENIKPEDNENLDEVRKTAKQICTYLVTKGGKIGIAVYDIFGQNFRTAINDLDRSELNSKIEELFEKIGKIDSDQNNKYTGHSTGICTDNNGDGITEHHCDFGWWSNGDSDANGWGGKPAHVANKGTLDLTPWCIHKSETYKTGDLKDYEVDYEYSILEGSGSIIGSTFRAKGDIGATTKIAITAKIGDVEIATTHIFVEVVEETEGTQGTGGAGEAGGSIETMDLSTNTDLNYGDMNISSIMASGYMVNLTSNAEGWFSSGLTAAKSSAINSLTTSINSIKSTLKNAGFISEKVDYACNTVKNFYTELINRVTDQMVGDGDGEYKIENMTFEDDKGESYTYGEIWYHHISDNTAHSVYHEYDGGAKNKMENYAFGLLLLEGHEPETSDFMFRINMKKVFALIQNCYNTSTWSYSAV